MIRRLLPALALALAACSGDAGSNDQANLDTLDAELAESTSDNGEDPLLTRAVNDPIMVDPQLAARSNADAVRPPSQPYAAPIPPGDVAPPPVKAETGGRRAPAPVSGKPCRECQAADRSLTLGALAESQPEPRLRGCAAGIRYGAGWANRLPADLPLHPAARVVEAAGTAGDCALRVVSFIVPRPTGAVIDWYYGHATAAGFSAEHQADGRQHVLGGTRVRDGGAYVLYLTPRGDGGTDVDLVANHGM